MFVLEPRSTRLWPEVKELYDHSRRIHDGHADSGLSLVGMNIALSSGKLHMTHKELPADCVERSGFQMTILWLVYSFKIKLVTNASRACITWAFLGRNEHYPLIRQLICPVLHSSASIPLCSDQHFGEYSIDVDWGQSARQRVTLKPVIMNLKDKLKTLGKVLSEGASINFPGDPDFYANTIRWSEYAAPQPGAVINVATETDVQKTVGDISLESLVIGMFLRQTSGDE